MKFDRCRIDECITVIHMHTLPHPLPRRSEAAICARFCARCSHSLPENHCSARHPGKQISADAAVAGGAWGGLEGPVSRYGQTDFCDEIQGEGPPDEGRRTDGRGMAAPMQGNERETPCYASLAPFPYSTIYIAIAAFGCNMEGDEGGIEEVQSDGLRPFKRRADALY